MLLFIVSCLADIDFFGWINVTRSTATVACDEHDKTPIDDFLNLMVSILASLDNFIREEVFLVLMYRLFGSIVPASIDPFLTFGILPGAIDLSNNRFGHVIGVLNVNPVPNLPMFVLVENTSR